MKNKLIKKGGALFLALFLFILTPITAFGYGDVTGFVGNEVFVKGKDEHVYLAVKELDKNAYFHYADSNILQKELSEVDLGFDYKYSVNKGDILGFDFVMTRGRYKGFSFTIDCYTLTASSLRGKTIFKGSGKVNGDTEVTDGDMNYYYSFSSAAASSNTFHYENAIPFSYNGEIICEIKLTDFIYTVDDISISVYLEGLNATVESPESGQAKKTLGLLESIKEAISKVVTGITELPSKISGFFSQLGDRISGFFDGLSSSLSTWFGQIGSWFTTLGDNIKKLFSDITKDLKKWFADVGKWFSDLTDDVGEFFNKLFNKIWWGNEKGEAAYNPPVFSSKLTDVIKKIDEYCDSLQNVLNQIDSAASSVSSNIKQGTQIIEQTLGVFPSVIIAFITFGIVLIFARKVVGR